MAAGLQKRGVDTAEAARLRLQEMAIGRERGKAAIVHARMALHTDLRRQLEAIVKQLDAALVDAAPDLADGARALRHQHAQLASLHGDVPSANLGTIELLALGAAVPGGVGGGMGVGGGTGVGAAAKSPTEHIFSGVACVRRAVDELRRREASDGSTRRSQCLSAAGWALSTPGAPAALGALRQLKWLVEHWETHEDVEEEGARLSRWTDDPGPWTLDPAELPKRRHSATEQGGDAAWLDVPTPSPSVRASEPPTPRNFSTTPSRPWAPDGSATPRIVDGAHTPRGTDVAATPRRWRTPRADASSVAAATPRSSAVRGDEAAAAMQGGADGSIYAESVADGEGTGDGSAADVATPRPLSYEEEEQAALLARGEERRVALMRRIGREQDEAFDEYTASVQSSIEMHEPLPPTSTRVAAGVGGAAGCGVTDEHVSSPVRRRLAQMGGGADDADGDAVAEAEVDATSVIMAMRLERAAGEAAEAQVCEEAAALRAEQAQSKEASAALEAQSEADAAAAKAAAEVEAADGARAKRATALEKRREKAVDVAKSQRQHTEMRSAEAAKAAERDVEAARARTAANHAAETAASYTAAQYDEEVRVRSLLAHEDALLTILPLLTRGRCVCARYSPMRTLSAPSVARPHVHVAPRRSKPSCTAPRRRGRSLPPPSSPSRRWARARSDRSAWCCVCAPSACRGAATRQVLHCASIVDPSLSRPAYRRLPTPRTRGRRRRLLGQGPRGSAWRR